MLSTFHLAWFELLTQAFEVNYIPGMEGCPVFDKDGRFIGVLIRPLRQKSTGAEIQVT